MPQPDSQQPVDASATRLRRHAGDVLRGSAAAAIVKVLTMAIGFLFNVVLARSLGADGTGVFYVALAVVTIASIVSRMGYDKTVVRFVAQHAESADWPAIRAVYLHALQRVTAVSLLLAVVLYFAAGWLAVVAFSSPDLEQPLAWLSLGLVPLALLALHGQFLKAIRDIGIALFMQNAAISALCLAGLLLLPQVGSLDELMLLYGAAIFAASVLAFWLWLYRGQVTGVTTTEAFDSDAIRQSGRALFVVSVVNKIVLPWGAILMLGVFAADADAGQFAIARRLAMLISFAYLAVDSVTAPKFAALFAAGDLQAVQYVARRCAVIMTAVAAPVALVFLAAPQWVLAFFGPGFTAAAPALAVLVAGQLVNAATGSTHNLLIMSGHEVVMRNVTILAGILLIVAGFVLVPLYGALGAAIATSASVVGLNLTALVMVRRKLGIWPLPLFARSAGGHNE